MDPNLVAELKAKYGSDLRRVHVEGMGDFVFRKPKPIEWDRFVDKIRTNTNFSAACRELVVSCMVHGGLILDKVRIAYPTFVTEACFEAINAMMNTEVKHEVSEL